MSSTIALLTDFGADSHYVGQMKGKICGIHPAANIVDITHSISPQNILEASYVLRDCIEAFPSGTVFVVVVDPGVGTNRRIVVVEANEQWFVLPDNGLITQVANDLGASGWEVDQGQFESSATFHGRDIMAPLAARVAAGQPVAEFNRGPTELVLLDSNGPDRRETSTGSTLTGRIVYVDRFGNLISNLRRELLQTHPDGGVMNDLGRFVIKLGETSVEGIQETYGHQKVGTLMALFGSNGQLELAVNQGNAAQQLNSQTGDEIIVEFLES